jgi:predicted glycoside hydrolase/deacetylase ChbG (UPF0249 family)/peroxiredoxin
MLRIVFYIILISTTVISITYAQDELKPSQKAPSFVLKLFDSDKAVNSKDIFAEKELTVLIIWDSFCAKCLEAVAECNKFYEDSRNLDVGVWSINFDNSEIAKVRIFIKAKEIKFPVIADPAGITVGEYGSKPYDFSFFIIDKNGIIQYVSYDHPPDVAQVIKGEVEKLLKKRMNEITLAEKMGYGPNDRILIIHADDVGMSHSVNMATADAFKSGMVKCGSIMVPCPWFPEVAAYCRENPDADLGLHLTLTSEWKYYRWGPVAPKDRVPSLVDEEGFLWRSSEQVQKNAKPDEVELELRAQIERAIKFGIKPTHLDTHMGTVFVRPEFFMIYCKLGKEYNIPILLPKPTPELMEMVKSSGFSENTFERIKELNFPLIDNLVTSVGPKETFEKSLESYHNALKNLKPGVNQIIVHLGMNDEELKGITNSYMTRYFDFKVFTDPETRKLLEELNIKLIGWKEIKKLGF